jgi:hypothetical protein
MNQRNRAKIELIIHTQQFIDDRRAELKNSVAEGDISLEEYSAAFNELSAISNHLQKLKFYLDPNEIQETN